VVPNQLLPRFQLPRNKGPIPQKPRPDSFWTILDSCLPPGDIWSHWGIPRFQSGYGATRARHTPGSLAADGIRGPGVTGLSGLRKIPNLTSLRLQIEPCQVVLETIAWYISLSHPHCLHSLIPCITSQTGISTGQPEVSVAHLYNHVGETGPRGSPRHFDRRRGHRACYCGVW
jgi:hypothetical protein